MSDRLLIPKEKRENVLKLIAAGNYQRTACRAAGISEWTFNEWRKKGEQAREDQENGVALTETQEELLWFVNELEDARAKAEAALVARWYTEAADGDWRAAERFLAKAFPERWSDPATRLEITGAQGGPVAQLSAHMHVLAEPDEDKQRKVLEALVESGDLPENVLEAWDGEKRDEGQIIDADVVEETVQSDNSSQPSSEATSVPDMELD
tara:strand:+ start:26664 stop:27293 length:630 start_codon:yes stop_codon:yes gene_type:complete